MSPVDPIALPHSTLREALVACARGLYSEEAAVQLLVSHEVWLRRRDFLSACVEVDDDGWTRDGTATLAAVNWSAARQFADTVPASSSGAAVLKLAADIAAGQLGQLALSLDRTNLALLLDALAHTAGWHERGVTHLVTGGAP